MVASNIDAFLVCGRKPSAVEAERSGKRGFGGGSSRLRQKKSAASNASEWSVRGSKLSARETERSGKREFGGFRNQQFMKRGKEKKRKKKKGIPALGLSPCYSRVLRGV